MNCHLHAFLWPPSPHPHQWTDSEYAECSGLWMCTVVDILSFSCLAVVIMLQLRCLQCGTETPEFVYMDLLV